MEVSSVSSYISVRFISVSYWHYLLLAGGGVGVDSASVD